jgi:hypothetical protein
MTASPIVNGKVLKLRDHGFKVYNKRLAGLGLPIRLTHNPINKGAGSERGSVLVSSTCSPYLAPWTVSGALWAGMSKREKLLHLIAQCKERRWIAEYYDNGKAWL